MVQFSIIMIEFTAFRPMREPETDKEHAWFDMAELFHSGYVLLDVDVKAIYESHDIDIQAHGVPSLLELVNHGGILGLSGLSIVSETYRDVRAWFDYDRSIEVEGFDEYLRKVVDDFLAIQESADNVEE